MRKVETNRGGEGRAGKEGRQFIPFYGLVIFTGSPLARRSRCSAVAAAISSRWGPRSRLPGRYSVGRSSVGIGILRLIPRTSERAAAAAAVSRTEPWSWSAARWRGGRRTRTRRGGRGSGGGSNLQRGNVLARELERDVVALRRKLGKGRVARAEAATILSQRPTTSEAQMSPHFLLRFLRFSDVKVRSNAECCT